MIEEVMGGGWMDACDCGVPRIQPQLEFITSLMSIGKKLSPLPTKEARSERMVVFGVVVVFLVVGDRLDSRL